MKFIEESNPLPLEARVGAAYLHGLFTVTADLIKPRDDGVRVGLGGEFTMRNILSLWAGYNSGNSYSVGAGLRWSNLSIGYSFVPYEGIEDTHRIGLRFRFR
jgi:hypothetical protein